MSSSLVKKAALRTLPVSLLLLVVLVASMVQGRHSAAQTPTALGVDVETAGNTATSIASIQECTAVDVGDTFPVDIYVSDVEELSVFELYFGFNGAVVEVVDHDLRQFLASASSSQVFIEADRVPNSSGRHFLGAADSRATETGAGVLVRLTLTAKAAGQSPAAILPIYVWPQLTSADGEPIGDTDGNKVFDGLLHEAAIAVGEPCPQPPPTPPSASPAPPPSETSPPGTPEPAPAAPGPDATPPPSGDNEPAPGGASDAPSVSVIPPVLPALTDSTLTTPGVASDASLLSALQPPLANLTDSTTSTTPVTLAEGSTPEAAGATPAAGGSSPPSEGGSSGLPLWLLAPLGLLAVGAGAGGLLVVKSARRPPGAR